MNKKFFIITILSVLAITGIVLFFKYKDLFNSSQSQTPPNQKEEIPTIKLESAGIIGSVVTIDENELVITTESGNITLDISSPPGIYMMEGEERIDKSLKDIRRGSSVKVYYLVSTNRNVPITIEIDKL